LIFLIVWLLGTLASFAVNSYLQGRADARFRDNRGITSNPPFVIGVISSPLWPLQIAFATLWGIYHLSTSMGKGDGMAINTELHSLRKFAGDFAKAEAETWRMLQERKIDPNNIDDNTKRALNARAIQWGMEEDAARRREEANLPAVRRVHNPPQTQFDKHGTDDRCETLTDRVDSMYEILDKAGVPVDNDEYDDYRSRTAGELDL
jgi:hypothetical protein